MTIDELIKELTALKEPSSNLDAHMFRLMIGPDHKTWRIFTTNAHWPLGGFQYRSPTGSIDAAVMLLKTVLPGFIYRVAECSVSDDAWVIPDFNHPRFGKGLLELFPDEAKKDPLEWMGTDVDQRPSGEPAIALCLSIVMAFKKFKELERMKMDKPTEQMFAHVQKMTEEPADGDKVVTIGVDLAEPGGDYTASQIFVTQEFHRHRERELLQANTIAVERYRAAEAELRELKANGPLMPSLLKLIDQRIAKYLNRNNLGQR